MASEKNEEQAASAPEKMKSGNAIKKPAIGATNRAPKDGSATNATAAEIGGRGGVDPTRYGDWEINGRCVDF